MVVGAAAEALPLEAEEEGQPAHHRCGRVRWARRGGCGEGKGAGRRGSRLPEPPPARGGGVVGGPLGRGGGRRTPSAGMGLLELEDALELGVGRRRNWTARRRHATRGSPGFWRGGSLQGCAEWLRPLAENRWSPGAIGPSGRSGLSPTAAVSLFPRLAGG